MDNSQWPQGIGLHVKASSINEANSKGGAVVERKPRPQKEQALNCPRCNSTNTKFCYYNNYSLSQPRYFCKTCRRYWTEGGTLRNVPVGGGSRKNKRSSSSSPSLTKKQLPDLTTPNSISDQNPDNKIIREGQDLNLAYNPGGPTPYTSTSSMSGLLQLPFGPSSKSIIDDPNPNSSLELLSRPPLMSSFMPLSDSNLITNNNIYSSLPSINHHHQHHEFKPKFSFSLDGLENGNYGSSTLQAAAGIHGEAGPRGGVHVETATSARLFLPYQELKPLSTTTDQYHEQNKGQLMGESPAGYWNGMLGGGSSW